MNQAVPAGTASRLTVPRVRELLLALQRDERLWRADFEVARDQLLALARSTLQVDCCSLWIVSGIEPITMQCRGIDSAPDMVLPAGVILSAERHPTYIGWLINQRLLDAEDTRSDPRTNELRADYFEPQGIGALLDVTLRREGRLVGVLCLEHRGGPRIWTAADREFATGLADLMGQLLLMAELRRRNRLQDLLLTLAAELSHHRELPELAQLALRRLIEHFPGVWAGFYRTTEDRDHVELLAFEGDSAVPDGARERLARLPIRNSLPELALQSGRVVYVADYPSSHLVTGAAGPLALQMGVLSAISIPLIHDGRSLGTVGIWVRRPVVITQDDMAGFELIAATFAIALANAVHASELRYQARHDVLTGLGNRAKLMDDLGQALEPARLLDFRQQRRLALLRFREFRQVLHTLGRASSDQLLVAMAERIRVIAAQARAQAYRLAGDEFALLYPIEAGGIDPVLGPLSERLGQPVELVGLNLLLRPQLGVATLPAHGRQPQEALNAADTALGWAEAETGGICHFDPVRDRGGPRNLELLADLVDAIDHDQLSLHLQPKIELRTGRVAGCEALLRWQHPRFGMVSPDRIVAVAEAGDLMHRLTPWVARRAVEHLVALRRVGEHFSVAINVSAQNLTDPGFPDVLLSLLDRAGLEPGALRLEITETMLMADPQRSEPVISALAARGFELDIDDFGTGYSSLAYLRRLPLKALKLDRTFVRELTHNTQDQVIVRSTLGLAHGLGLKLVAEGVEDDATLGLLQDLGCDLAQGYGLCRPLEFENLLQWLRQRQRQGEL